MSYGLGVDLGTTFTAAAVARDGRVEMVTLGDHTDAVPSVVLIRDDGTVLTGGAAERRATVEPERVARGVKRRFGDPMPVILGGAPHPATALIAHQLRDVVDAVSDREGGRPGVVTLTHPANWGPYKRELFAQVPRLAGLGEAHMLTEPEAAAAHYARNDRLDPGALVAVYDLGGGTFDATVLRTTEHGFDILGHPEGIEGLGGLDFDEAVFTHVDQALDGVLSRLDPADPRATSAAIRLRHECVTAKETLSADTETTIPVLLPELQTEVRLTRGEFEKMIRPAIDATIASLRRALQSARIDPPQLHTVLLVGGSSRIPMVAHLVSAELGRPTSVDTHPKHAIALGAAAASAETAGIGVAAIATAEPVRLTQRPAGKADPTGTSAPVPHIAAAAGAPILAAAPALAAPAGDRLGRLRWRRERSASSLEHDGDGHPGQHPHQPPDDQSPARPRRRRLPVVIGVLVLVAALTGAGVAVQHTLSDTTNGGGSGTTTGGTTPPSPSQSHKSSGTGSTGSTGGSGGSGGSGGTDSTGGSGRPGNTVRMTNPGNQTGTVGTAVSLQITATDSASGQTLTYGATGLPAGLSISSGGLVSGTPTTTGTSSVTVTAQDTTGASRSVSFTWTIAGNTVNVTNPGNQTGTVGTAASLQVHATDSASGQTPTYGATGLPAGLSISSGGLISGTPTTTGTSSVTVTAKDTTGASGTTSFTWTIAGNTVNVTNPGNQTGTVGTAVSLQITATDSASGQTPTYEATGLPAGLSISSGGLISGTPTTPGTSSVTVTAQDTTGASGTTSFTWTISTS